VTELVRAAGGIVVRDGHVLLVHREEYDDWSFPKGKLDPGETWEEAAAREVWEETGLRCAVGEELGRTHYEVEAGPKEVRYYLMEAGQGAAAACNEVSAVRWVPLADAERVLSYERDRGLLSRLR
jgi:8-oxo-dGTP diphosphatase